VTRECGNPRWGDDNIQFPRLLSEICSTVSFTRKQWRELCESMDCSRDEIEELLDRAHAAWDRIKERSRQEDDGGVQRYEVHGFYEDEPQVVVDVVDAMSCEDAEAKVTKARGGDLHGYTCDGAAPLAESMRLTQKLLDASPEHIAEGIERLAKQYADPYATAEDEELYGADAPRIRADRRAEDEEGQ
jgi:hypothetical protein